MKKENSEKSIWIDIHNDNTMREMGLIRTFERVPRDKDVWQKTPREKRILKSVKHGKNTDMHFHTIPYRHLPIYLKLTIYLKKNDKYPKTTYSTMCWIGEIPEVLSRYQISNSKTKKVESAILKYSFNGKTYKANELPWGI